MIFSLTTHAVTKASVVRRKRARINIPDDIPRATHLKQTATPPGAPRGGGAYRPHGCTIIIDPPAIPAGRGGGGESKSTPLAAGGKAGTDGGGSGLVWLQVSVGGKLTGLLIFIYDAVSELGSRAVQSITLSV